MTGRLRQLSADLPRCWLTDPRFLRLSYEAHHLWIAGLMWCIGQTDGFIEEDSLPFLLPRESWDQQRKFAAELVKAEHWVRVTGGWQVPDWTEHQSTLAQIEANRAATRKRMARHRARKKSDAVTDAVSDASCTDTDTDTGKDTGAPAPTTDVSAYDESEQEPPGGHPF